MRFACLAAFGLMAATSFCDVQATQVEHVAATAIKKKHRENYKFVPMLLVTHEAGGDALARMNPVFNDEFFRTITDTTHAGMVEEGSYYALPQFDIYATAYLVPHDDDNRNPLEYLKAAKDGYILVQFTTPDCASCDALARNLAQWSDAHGNLPLRWIAVDLTSSHLRGCWNGYRFEVTGWSDKPPSSEQKECLR